MPAVEINVDDVHTQEAGDSPPVAAHPRAQWDADLGDQREPAAVPGPHQPAHALDQVWQPRVDQERIDPVFVVGGLDVIREDPQPRWALGPHPERCQGQRRDLETGGTERVSWQTRWNGPCIRRGAVGYRLARSHDGPPPEAGDPGRGLAAWLVGAFKPRGMVEAFRPSCVTSSGPETGI